MKTLSILALARSTSAERIDAQYDFILIGTTDFSTGSEADK